MGEFSLVLFSYVALNAPLIIASIVQVSAVIWKMETIIIANVLTIFALFRSTECDCL